MQWGQWVTTVTREMETIGISWTAPRVTTRTMKGAVTLTTKTCTATVIVSLLQSPPWPLLWSSSYSPCPLSLHCCSPSCCCSRPAVLALPPSTSSLLVNVATFWLLCEGTWNVSSFILLSLPSSLLSCPWPCTRVLALVHRLLLLHVLFVLPFYTLLPVITTQVTLKSQPMNVTEVSFYEQANDEVRLLPKIAMPIEIKIMWLSSWLLSQRIATVSSLVTFVRPRESSQRLVISITLSNFAKM